MDVSDLHKCVQAAELVFALFPKGQKQQEQLLVVESNWCTRKCVSGFVYVVYGGVFLCVHAHPALSLCGVLSLHAKSLDATARLLIGCSRPPAGGGRVCGDRQRIG